MINIAVLIIVFEIGFVLGWFLSKKYFRVKELIEALSILTELIMRKISNEEALEKIKKITKKFDV